MYTRPGQVNRPRTFSRRKERPPSLADARALGGKTIPPSHTQVDWRLFVEGEEDDADAAALLADVFGGDAAEDADEAAAAPACWWPRFDAALRALRDSAGDDAAPVAGDEAERFAALVRILVCRLRGSGPFTRSVGVTPSS